MAKTNIIAITFLWSVKQDLNFTVRHFIFIRTKELQVTILALQGASLNLLKRYTNIQGFSD